MKYRLKQYYRNLTTGDAQVMGASKGFELDDYFEPVEECEHEWRYNGNITGDDHECMICGITKCFRFGGEQPREKAIKGPLYGRSKVEDCIEEQKRRDKEISDKIDRIINKKKYEPKKYEYQPMEWYQPKEGLLNTTNVKIIKEEISYIYKILNELNDKIKGEDEEVWGS